MIDVKLIKKPKNTGTAADGGIATNGNGYNTGGVVKEATHAARADLAKYADNTGKANEATHAKEAEHAKAAFDLDLDSPIRKLFLSKLADDVAAGHITFEEGITALLTAYFKGGAHFGDFVSGLSGAHVDSRGNAEVESLTSRSFLKVYELIYNRLNALEGDFSFSDSATIESVQALPDGRLRCVLRKRWDGDFNAFQYGDIVYGFVNNLASSGLYAKAWGNVVAVERGEGNYIDLSLYPNSEVDGGYNAPFTSGMLIARHGNSIEPNSSSAALWPQFIRESSVNPGTFVNMRQSSFFISAPEGCIKYLHGVNAPRITSANLGMVLGRIPEGLFPAGSAIGQMAADGLPRIYSKGIITQEIIRTDYRGLPIRTQNYRGEWSAQTAFSPTEYYTSNNELYDLVTYDGILYMCISPGTKQTPQPDDPECGWLPVTDHRDVNVWSIEPNSEIFVKKLSEDGDEEILSPGVLRLTVTLNSASGVREIEDPVDLWNDWGMAIFEDKGNVPDYIADEDGFGVQSEDGAKVESESLYHQIIIGEDYSVYPLTFGESRTFLLVDLASGNVVARKTVRVVTDGRDGTDGKPGGRGPMAYPAGEYDTDETYDSRSGVSPIVLCDGQYFILKAGNLWEREALTPAQDAVSSDPHWELVDQFKTVFTDILMANFAKLSSAVFYGNYMMSTQGTSSAGIKNSAYKNVDVYLDILEGKTEIEAGKDPVYPFRPKFLLNLRTGQMWGDSLTAGNTVFGYDDVKNSTGIYGSVALNYNAVTTLKEFTKSGISHRLTGANPDDITEGSVTLGGFTTSRDMTVRLGISGLVGVTSYLNGNPRFESSAEVTFQVRENATNQTIKEWTVSVNDNTDNKVQAVISPYSVHLPKGVYYLVANYKMRFKMLQTEVPEDESRGYAIVRITSFGVAVPDQYRSIYGGNGFLLGSNANNYIMAIVDEAGGLNFTAENKAGFGLRMTSEGISVKEGGVWSTLKEYIKANAK